MNLKSSSLILFVITGFIFIQTSYSSDDLNVDNKYKRRALRSNNTSDSKKLQYSRSAIVTLTTKSNEDINELCTAMKSLKNLQGDRTSPILVFNEGNLNSEQMYFLSMCTDRTVAFPVVHLNGQYPPHFNPTREWDDFRKKFNFEPLKGRDNWSYAQMIRFWTLRLWKHPAIQQFDTVMRMDTDSCFIKHDQIPPNLVDMSHHVDILPDMESSIVYQSLESPPSYNTFVQGLFEFAMKYIKRENITPSNPQLWKQASDLWEKEKNVPLFKTNFEVARVSFFQRPDVVKWHEALSEFEPFGIWRQRWGDAHHRFLTMAIFGTPETVSILSLDINFYDHGRGKCASLNVIA